MEILADQEEVLVLLVEAEAQVLPEVVALEEAALEQHDLVQAETQDNEAAYSTPIFHHWLAFVPAFKRTK